MPNTPPEKRRRAGHAAKPAPAATTPATPAPPAEAFRGQFRLGWAAAIIGGLAGALAHEPVAARPLIVLAPLGCFLAIRWAPSLKGALLRALVFGWLYYFGALSWLLTIRAYAPAPWIGILGVVVLGLYLAVYPVLTALFVRRSLNHRPPLQQYLGFASLWLLLEWLRTLGRLGMPLAQLGHAWATWTGAIQIAEFLGELGVSLEVLYLAGLIYYWARHWALRHAAPAAVLSPLARIRQTFAPAALTFLVPAAAILMSLMLIARVRPLKVDPRTPRFTVAMIQPNIAQPDKWASYAADTPEATRISLIRMINTRAFELLTPPRPGAWDFALLPETAFMGLDLANSAETRALVGDRIRRLGVDVQFGADRDISDETHFEAYNSAWFVHRDGTFDTHIYDKMRLVPFGESMPYFDKIPGLQTLVGIGSFNEGARRVLFETSGLKFGTLICFESTFSAMGRALARQGAQFLTVITNDAWYGRSGGAPMHHHVALLRAVETRRWVLRAANTGISSVIAPTGRAVASLGLEEQGALSYAIPRDRALLTPPTTFYMRQGNAWMALPLIVIVALTVRKSIRKKRTKA